MKAQDDVGDTPAKAASTQQSDEEFTAIHDLFVSEKPHRIEYYFANGVVVSDRVHGTCFVGFEEGEDSATERLETEDVESTEGDRELNDKLKRFLSGEKLTLIED